MTSLISHTSIDCSDAYAQSQWWKQVLGYVDDPDDPNEAGHEECWIQRPDAGHAVLFIQVQESKATKNRIHFDLRPTDGSQEEEYQRLLAIGATLAQDHRGIYGPGSGWVTLADPEGNEFCILGSVSEREAWLAAQPADGA